jgi:hypothetical protein
LRRGVGMAPSVPLGCRGVCTERACPCRGQPACSGAAFRPRGQDAPNGQARQAAEPWVGDAPGRGRLHERAFGAVVEHRVNGSDTAAWSPSRRRRCGVLGPHSGPTRWAGSARSRSAERRGGCCSSSTIASRCSRAWSRPVRPRRAPSPTSTGCTLGALARPFRPRVQGGRSLGPWPPSWRYRTTTVAAITHIEAGKARDRPRVLGAWHRRSPDQVVAASLATASKPVMLPDMWTIHNRPSSR